MDYNRFWDDERDKSEWFVSGSSIGFGRMDVFRTFDR